MRHGWQTVLLLAGLATGATGFAADRAEAGWTGHWTGTLEYRDYGNGKRVTLPTQLDVVPADDGDLDFRYVYDDGPGKTVRDTSRVRIDRAGRRYVVGEGDEREVYRIVEITGRADGDAERLLLSGSGKENDQKVTIRTSIVRDGDQLSILRESQLPGEPFKFRHQYRLLRTAANAP